MNNFNLFKLKLKRKFFQALGKEPKPEYYSGKLTRLGNRLASFTVDLALLNAQSKIMCFGVGLDVSFDLALIEHTGAEIFAYDPSPHSIVWVKAQTFPAQFHFEPLGLADFDGQINLHPNEKLTGASQTILPTQNQMILKAGSVIEVRKLSTLINNLNFDKLDLLKMDIEGAEIQVIQNILAEKIPIKQIAVEFHHNLIQGLTIQQTFECVRILRQAGYIFAHVSEFGHEYLFIKR